MVKRKKFYLSTEEKKSQVNLIVRIHNTLNMMQERSIDRKSRYVIEAVTTNSAENEGETKYVKMKNKMADNMYVNVLEKQQILSLQTTLQEEKDFLYKSQVKESQERRRAALNSGSGLGASASKSSHNLQQKGTQESENKAWLTVKGTPVPRNPTTSTRDTSPCRRYSEPENKNGIQSRKTRSNIAINKQVTVRPEVDFARDAALRESKRQEKEEKEQKRWDGIKLKELTKWDNLEVKPNRSRSPKVETNKSENTKKEVKSDDIANNIDGSGENISGMMKFIYAPFFWLRKSINGD